MPNVKGVEIRTVTNNSVSIYITTDQNSKIGLSYGTSLNQLTQVQKNSAYSKSALINLSGLSPSANYYFKFSATNQNGNQIISDVYSFTTAKAPPSATIDTTSLVVTSNDSILSSGDNSQQSASGSGAQSQQSPIIVIPESTVFQVKFVLKNTSNVKKVQAIVRLNQAATQISRNESKNSKVLGAQLVPEADASTAIVDLVESEPGIYTGKLKTTNLIGDYEIIAKIYDTKGNITEQKIGNLKVIHKFSVFSKKDNKPIEGVRVYLYVYSSGKYIPVPSSSISSGNPVFTDLNGQLLLVLPQGKYRALVTNIQYKDQFVNFTLGASGDQDFPAVYLEPEKLSLLKLVRYYSRTTNDVFLYYTIAYAQALTGSSRFFDLVSAMTLCALALLTLFAFSKRHHVPLSSMISYFYYLVDHKKSEKYIHGVIYDEKNKPIPSANVYIADSSDEQIVEKVRTNSRGEFFSRKGGKEYSILIMAKGYKSTPLLQYKDKEGLKFKVILEKEHEGLNLTENIAHLINSMIGMSFEALEIITIIFELLFINSFGLIKTLPFLVISIFNLLLWVLYLRHHHEIEY